MASTADRRRQTSTTPLRQDVTPIDQNESGGLMRESSPTSPMFYHERQALVDPLRMLCVAIRLQSRVELSTADREVLFADFNCTLPADQPTGYMSKRGEEFSLGDLWLLHHSARQDYTFSHISELNFRYINVLERPGIIAFLQSGDYHHPAPSPARGAAAVQTPRQTVARPMDPSRPLGFAGSAAGVVLKWLDEPRGGKETASLATKPLNGEQPHGTTAGVAASTPLNTSPRHGDEGAMSVAELSGVSHSGLADGVDSSLSPSSRKRAFHRTQFDILSLLSPPPLQYGCDDAVVSSNIVSGLAASQLRRSDFLNELGIPESWAVAALSCPARSRHADVSARLGGFARAVQLAEVIFPRGGSGSSGRAISGPPAKIARTATPNSARGGKAEGGGGGERHALFTGGDMLPMSPYRCPTVLDEVVGKLRQRPLIIVPSESNSALINKRNVIDFLQNGSFNTTTNSRSPTAVGGAPSQNDKNELQTQINGKNIKFRVIDSARAPKLSPREWPAVVAVIVSGAEWQFKNWPFHNFQDLFRTIHGVHFASNDAPIPHTVNLWQCKIFRIHRTHKHYHASIQAEFWRSLTAFMLSRRKSALATDAQLLSTSS